jgi:DNA adenine methylase
VKPIIRWAGSKRKLLPELERYWSGESKRYVEPFCGSSCLFFHLEPEAAILGDLNADLIKAYKALQQDPFAVCRRLQRLPRGESAFYAIRAQRPKAINDIAARFLFLNRYCFNGIYRTNLNGDFNVPYASDSGATDFDYKFIREAAALLRRALLVSGDFAKTLSLVEEGDFVFLDPPYAVAARRIFREYAAKPFETDDIGRLAEWLDEINRRKATFVICYADSREARSLLKNWSPRRIRARRHIAGFASDRRHAFELIASNLNGTSYAN